MRVRDFIDRHFRHFNAATLREAALAYEAHIAGGGQMMVMLAGAMSTAELGVSLAAMIRAGKVHAITTTGANLEEDLFNLVAHDLYYRIPNWRDLTAEQEKDLERQGLNRVTDTCIPETEAFRAVEQPLRELWETAAARGERLLPHEFLFRLIRDGTLADRYQIDPADSWLVAACERDLPLFVPGWEDSTLGNVFVAEVMRGRLPDTDVVRPGTDYMAVLANWYARATMGAPCDELPAIDDAAAVAAWASRSVSVPGDDSPAIDDGAAEAPTRPRVSSTSTAPLPAVDDGAAKTPTHSIGSVGSVGCLQIGGGIAGDFPICVVPMIRQDLRREVPYWGYFCQISDSTTSYGSYSGAVPNEKISWGKLAVDTPRFIVESDATIVAPLLFGYVLDC